jgi:hypothetical protein
MVKTIYVEIVADLCAFSTSKYGNVVYVGRIFVMVKNADVDILTNLHVFGPLDRKKWFLEYHRSVHMYVPLASV